ncbi:peptidoglycan DD-metalloendopeptidase family protein [uncultured Photobacterium sp.]|uniref:peptidoglycan DD-metalloendopeptidase family protein n=1 Tax=uncultured Photobacterium sp. TaxID=173973 RepID=UPI002618EEEA|nr:peptidoglycan DD-metalloendopeptidase family protein [uncultured Photobacterium sp.]
MNKLIYIYSFLRETNIAHRLVWITLLFALLVIVCISALSNYEAENKIPLLSENTNFVSGETKAAFSDTKTDIQPESKYYTGIIRGSFFSSALEAGLSPNDVNNLVIALNKHFNFVMTPESNAKFGVRIQPGDKEKKARIDTFAYFGKSDTFIAKRHRDGRFYNELGDPLNGALISLPTKRRYGISSSFCYSRKHPITGRRGAHLGTDYLTPVGTDVITVASGKVITSRYHPVAGDYVVILHDNGYVTRYLHLSKRLVNKDDHVQQGQIIALSGNTGRSTGPHLHFELIINGKAVDFEHYYSKQNKIQSFFSAEEKTQFNNEITETLARFSEQFKGLSLG